MGAKFYCMHTVLMATSAFRLANARVLMIDVICTALSPYHYHAVLILLWYVIVCDSCHSWWLFRRLVWHGTHCDVPSPTHSTPCLLSHCTTRCLLTMTKGTAQSPQLLSSCLLVAGFCLLLINVEMMLVIGVSFSALMLFVGWQEGHLACRNSSGKLRMLKGN